ncbi:MAG: hypothetical protein GY789_06200 [Hyphomicrobiales bacterium]|nr:hypothetical protein [Hyphomicrobiales bacterium]
MPKPLTDIKNYSGVVYHIAGGNSPLNAQPEIAIALAEVFAAWGGLELAMLKSYTAMIGGKQKLTADIFFSLKTVGPKRAAIRAIAEYRLNKSQLQIFLAISSLVASCQKERDKLAHWVYGSILLEPTNDEEVLPHSSDHIALIDPREFAIDKGRRRAYAYSEKDFQSIAKRINKTALILSSFTRAVRGHPADERNRRFQLLTEEPFLKEALSYSMKNG